MPAREEGCVVSMLQVRDGKVVDATGRAVMLRGVCIGGWMNLENFIDGFPGAEHDLRSLAVATLGREKGEQIFDSLLDHFFREADVAYLASCGANVVRLGLNYRHFEDDREPFAYLEKGFSRLAAAVDWCARHDVYAILDLHAVQGHQGPDWHCDNSSRRSMFWGQRGFQDRFVALWEEIARRFAGNAAVAGYDLMNEPVVNSARGTFPSLYEPGWDGLNELYRRAVRAVRDIDPDHILFLEGDYYAERFAGLDPPFAENLVYSCHSYPYVGETHEPYPGVVRGPFDGRPRRWDKQVLRDDFVASEGYRFAVQHGVPLWVGEFGPVYREAEEIGWRSAVLSDQIEIFDELGIHWTLWTYKDVGVQGVVQVEPDSEYLRVTGPARSRTVPIFPRGGLGQAEEVKGAIRDLADRLRTWIGDPVVNAVGNRLLLEYSVVENYVNNLLQPQYVAAFESMSNERIESVMQSFDLDRCRQSHVAEVLKRHLKSRR
jgi:endoglucanase